MQSFSLACPSTRRASSLSKARFSVFSKATRDASALATQLPASCVRVFTFLMHLLQFFGMAISVGNGAADARVSHCRSRQVTVLQRAVALRSNRCNRAKRATFLAYQNMQRMIHSNSHPTDSSARIKGVPAYTS